MDLNIAKKLSSFIFSSKRVLVIARKPNWQEYQTMAKVTGLGILVIAVLGYVIYLFFAFSPIR